MAHETRINSFAPSSVAARKNTAIGRSFRGGTAPLPAAMGRDREIFRVIFIAARLVSFIASVKERERERERDDLSLSSLM